MVESQLSNIPYQIDSDPTKRKGNCNPRQLFNLPEVKDDLGLNIGNDSVVECKEEVGGQDGHDDKSPDDAVQISR